MVEGVKLIIGAVQSILKLFFLGFHSEDILFVVLYLLRILLFLELVGGRNLSGCHGCFRFGGLLAVACFFLWHGHGNFLEFLFQGYLLWFPSVEFLKVEVFNDAINLLDLRKISKIFGKGVIFSDDLPISEGKTGIDRILFDNSDERAGYFIFSCFVVSFLFDSQLVPQLLVGRGKPGDSFLSQFIFVFQLFDKFGHGSFIPLEKQNFIFGLLNLNLKMGFVAVILQLLLVHLIL